MKKRILLYVLLAIVVIISGSLFIHYNRVQNVFDEMYYSWDGLKVFVDTRFKNVSALKDERIQGIMIPGDNKRTNILSLSYNKEYLKENTDVTVRISPDEKRLAAICKIIYAYPIEGEDYPGGEKLYFKFSYDVSTKKMKIEPIYATSDFFVEKYPDKYKRYNDYSDPEYITMFMEEHGITKEEIEAYRDYFLNEVIIGMWVDGNDEESRYDRYDAGKFKIEDELFANFE